jgi:hypothetical protein
MICLREKTDIDKMVRKNPFKTSLKHVILSLVQNNAVTKIAKF